MKTKRKQYFTRGFKNCVQSMEKSIALIVLSVGTKQLAWSQIQGKQ